MPNRPETKADLWLFIVDHFGVRMPWKVWGQGPNDSSPFDFIADGFFHPGANLAAWANRGGGKTLGASLLAGLEHTFYDDLHARLLAGKLDQADVLYSYLKEWLFSPLLRGRLADRKPGRRLSRIGGGTIEVLTASDSSVRGPHVQRLYQDEIDSWQDKSLIAASLGMVSTRNGIPGRRIVASTWHHATGPMDDLTSRHKELGLRLHRWTIWESIKQCPLERHEQGRGCQSCELSGPCVAKAQETKPGTIAGIASRQPCGLIAVDDAINLLQGWSKAQWDAEAECKRPSVEGLVYPEFDPFIHGIDATPEHLTVYRAIDWGLNVFVCLWLGVAKDGTAYLLDTYRAEQGKLKQHADFINNHKHQNIKATYCDPAGRQRNDQTGRTNIQEFQRWGIPCTFTLAPKLVNIQNGVRMVKAALQPATGAPKFRYLRHDGNKPFVRAMQSYSNRKVNGIWIDEPVDPQEYSHQADAFRYFVVNRNAQHGIVRVGLGAH